MMMKGLVIALLAVQVLAQSTSKIELKSVDSPIPDQAWGYIPINQQYGSNMFWWLYGSQNSDRTSAPLVIWLQGGPGGSSLFGDFVEIGPLDVNLQPRAQTWLKSANLLFIDNPVGTGYSYTEDPKGFCTTDVEVGDQLVFFLTKFFQDYPVFQTQPLWIFCESYGGKMTSYFGVALDKAIKAKQIQANFMGVGLGDGWVGPVECMYSYADFLQTISLINEEQATEMNSYADFAQQALDNGNGDNATNWWGIQQEFMEAVTGGVNIYNYQHFDQYQPDSQLDDLITNNITEELKIIPPTVTWGGQSNDVFEHLSGDFMKPSIDQVDYLLNAGYQVAVYSGQLDIIVDNSCTQRWMKLLKWNGLTQFLKSTRNTLQVGDTVQGFSQKYKNLSFYQILGAGHMVPYDNPDAAYSMFTEIIGSV